MHFLLFIIQHFLSVCAFVVKKDSQTAINRFFTIFNRPFPLKHFTNSLQFVFLSPLSPGLFSLLSFFVNIISLQWLCTRLAALRVQTALDNYSENYDSFSLSECVFRTSRIHFHTYNPPTLLSLTRHASFSLFRSYFDSIFHYMTLSISVIF